MAFDEDVLSALEEAFGMDSASLMEELEMDGCEDPAGDLAGEDSLDELVSRVDAQLSQAAAEQVRPAELQRRSRSIEDMHIIVALGDSFYGLPMKNVVEIQQLPQVTYLPNLPAWIPGVCNLRGNIVSVVNLKQLLGFEPTALSSKTRFVVVRTDSQDLTTGLMVDEVVRIAEADPARIRRPVGRLEGQLGAYLKGTYEIQDAILCILDLETMLNSPTLRLG
jgi:purine-binding chemotaxis protein CheW